MNNSTIALKQLISNLESYLIGLGYSSKTIKRYHSCWMKIQKHCIGIGIEDFYYEKCLAIIREEYNIPSLGKLKSHHVFYIRTINVLNEFAMHGKILKCHQKSGVQVVAEYENLISAFENFGWENGLNNRTIRSKSIHMTRFLNYINEYDITEINQLKSEIVLSYVKHLSELGYASNTKSGMLFTLREFLSFLYEKNYITIPLHQLFPVIFTNKMDRIPSYYNEKELKDILLQVNRNTAIGKRDYLILLFSVQLGIRAGDIRMMKLKHIDWGKNTIEFIQQKSKNIIQLPLPENIKYAIIDYLKNGRPENISDLIFIRHRAPFEPYAYNNVFHQIITKYMDKAMISYSDKKHGLHSMRHSMASNLLKNNIPYPVITGILGHESSETTKVYLSIDIEQLRSVALEVPYEV